jgi:hypothetical protein
LLLLVLVCVVSILVVLPCGLLALSVVPSYAPGLVGGVIVAVTCLFLSQSLSHTLVCNCLLISLLALVILIRVGGPPLRVMSVRSISSSIVVMVAALLFVLF